MANTHTERERGQQPRYTHIFLAVATTREHEAGHNVQQSWLKKGNNNNNLQLLPFCCLHWDFLAQSQSLQKVLTKQQQQQRQRQRQQQLDQPGPKPKSNL